MYWDSTDRYRAGSQWTNDTWHHWAVVRSGTGTNNIKFYWNGAYITQWSSNSAFAISDWGQRYTAPGSSQYYLDGYMDEIRLTDGVARYSGTSTGVWTNFYNEKSGKSSGDAIDYPWATSISGSSGGTGTSDGDSYWYNTTLLINSEDQSFQDKSPSGHTLVASGGAGIVYNESYVKYGTGSLYFDGDGDYLTLPASSDWNFRTEPFTVE